MKHISFDEFVRRDGYHNSYTWFEFKPNGDYVTKRILKCLTAPLDLTLTISHYRLLMRFVTLSEYYQWIKAKRSFKFREWLPQLKRKLLGFRNYFGLPDNSRSLANLYSYVLHTLYKWLNRRSGRQSYNWSNFKKMLTYFKIEVLKVSKRNVVVD